MPRVSLPRRDVLLRRFRAGESMERLACCDAFRWPAEMEKAGIGRRYAWVRGAIDQAMLEERRRQRREDAASTE